MCYYNYRKREKEITKMFKIFKKNKKEVVNNNNKFYKVIKVYNIWTQEEEIINKVFDKVALNNMVINGYEIIEMEEI
jgi:hypothetical protein